MCYCGDESTTNSLALGVIAAIAGILLMAYGFVIYREANRSSNWKSTKAKIISSKLTSAYIEETKIDYSETSYKSEKVNVKKYIAEIKYAYKHDKKKKYSNTIALNYYYSKDKQEHQKIVNRFYKGKITKAYYNPYYPSSTVLIKNYTKGVYKYFFIGIGVFLLGILLIFSSKKNS